MSSRHRTCGHLLPNITPAMPVPAQLARLNPVMRVLIDCAAAFDEVDEGGTWEAVEFVRWLDVEVRAAARSQGAA